ncbi:MAG: peptide chain release factor-like protein [Verrucomicrobiota bacterium]|nr:peptide chain release factor-like protein [Verrucomicrobiota bacterium]
MSKIENFIKERNACLLSDELLLKQCKWDFFRSTGKGGQKKNKTDSAARITHIPTEISTTAGNSRSKKENQLKALRSLKLQIAFNIRKIPPSIWKGSLNLNPSNPKYPLMVASVFDCLATSDFAVGKAALILNISTGQLIKFLKKNTQIWQEVNEKRKLLNLKALI